MFADVDPETLNLDPHAVESIVRERNYVAALLVVPLYGLPADIGHLLDIAADNGPALIEDAAQAHGAKYDGQYVGTLRDVGCFSFYPTKRGPPARAARSSPITRMSPTAQPGSSTTAAPTAISTPRWVTTSG